MPQLPPFPLELLKLPDVELAIAARTWTIAHRLQFMDISVDGVPLRDLSAGSWGVHPDRIPDGQIAPELLTTILFDAAAQMHGKIAETDNVILVGVEKALRLAEPDAQGNVTMEALRRAGGMIRQFVNHQKYLMAALDEAATRRRHQSAIGRKRRPSFLRIRLTELVRANPVITTPQAIDEVEREANLPPPADPEAPRIECVDRTADDGKGSIEWREPGRDAAKASLRSIKDMLTDIRQELGLSRPKKAAKKI
jgi:hypothetical protein